MIEIPEGMSDEEFKEFWDSATEEQRVEISWLIARHARETGYLTEEEYAKRKEKIALFAKSIEDFKKVEEMQTKIKRAKQLVEDRIEARFKDIEDTAESDFYSKTLNKKSH